MIAIAQIDEINIAHAVTAAIVVSLEALVDVVGLIVIVIHSHWSENNPLEIEITHLLEVFSCQIRIGVFQSITEGKEHVCADNSVRIILSAIAFHSINGIFAVDTTPLDWQRTLRLLVDAPLHTPEAFVSLQEAFRLQCSNLSLHVALAFRCGCY